MLSSLRHPNIVVFYGACTSQPSLCIITEWIPKGSLKNLLEDPMIEIDYNNVISFAIDIARGLQFLHAHDPPIIHRDLKSENLLVTNNWRIKVTDFGLSRFKDPNYTYMHPSCPFDVTISSPEVLDKNHISEKADVFSYGLILWELWTRKKPYVGKNPHWVAKSVVNDSLRPPLPLEMPPALTTLTEKCWHQDHIQRPTVSEILTELEVVSKTSDSTGFVSLRKSFDGTTPSSTTVVANNTYLNSLPI